MDVCRDQGCDNAIDILQVETICDKLSLDELQRYVPINILYVIIIITSFVV